jgi:hypothetical protein
MKKYETAGTLSRPSPQPIKSLLSAALVAITLTWASPAVAAPPSPAPMTNQAQNNRPYLLVFPVIVLGIIGALVIITRKKK